MLYQANLFYVMVPGHTAIYGAFPNSLEACRYADSQRFVGYRVRDGVYLNYLNSEHSLELVAV